MRTELLAPAASPAVCEAVLAAGADAVYLGGDKFSARALAPNFSEDEILAAIDLAHLFGRRIYLAVNTLLKNSEINRALYSYLKPLYEHGLDAIIIQDYGVFQFVKRYFPDLSVHCSTQMSVAGTYGAAWLEKSGAARVILARELSLSEIRAIHEATNIEIESFVHGALCYSYSGQCLLSSLIGGRSGNRGRCAQPCRLPYCVSDAAGAVLGCEDGYPLSLKDLCAIDLLPQMCEAGVHAFKIEGRMKSLPYAAGVTRIYRDYLDLYARDPVHYAVRKEDRERLLALGNRNGFTRGYYETGAEASMLSGADSSHVSSEAEAVYEPADPPRILLAGRAVLRPGEPMALTVSRIRSEGDASLFDGDASLSESAEEVTVQGEIVQPAENRPLRKEDVRTQLNRTGDTAFAFSSLFVEMEGACFAPLGQINALRRTALAALSDEILRPARRDPCEDHPHGIEPSRREAAQVGVAKTAARTTAGAQGASDDTAKQTVSLNVMVCTPAQLAAALECPFVDRISLDLDADACFEAAGADACPAVNDRFFPHDYLSVVEEARARIAAAGKRTGYCFPHVFRADTAKIYCEDDWAETLSRFDSLWVRSYDSLGFVFFLPGIRPDRICLDYGIPVFSDAAYRAFVREGIGAYTAAPELNAGELAHMPNERAELILYGYMPVMISAQCVYRNYGACGDDRDDTGCRKLTDRYENAFLVKKACKDCYNVIYNSRPLSLFSRAEEIRLLGFGSYRISLTLESKEQTAALLADYERAVIRAEKIAPPADARGYTNGHFRRGVE